MLVIIKVCPTVFWILFLFHVMLKLFLHTVRVLWGDKTRGSCSHCLIVHKLKSLEKILCKH